MTSKIVYFIWVKKKFEQYKVKMQSATTFLKLLKSNDLYDKDLSKSIGVIRFV